MFNIGDYLKKFSKLDEDSTSVRRSVAEALANACGGNPVPFDLDRGIVYIEGSSTLKALIFMNKQRIIEAIDKAAPQARVRDIR